MSAQGPKLSRYKSFIARLRKPLTKAAKAGAHVAGLVIRILGVAALILIILAFTRIPFDAHRALALSQGDCTEELDLLVILGGSGMPSGPELLRLHHGAQKAVDDPSAIVVLVHPKDTAVMQAMVDELVLKGVERNRIHQVLEGTNTREQAVKVAAAFPHYSPSFVVGLVTAPENMYRTVKSFRKVGFENVCGIPAFDHAMFVDLGYDHRRVGGRAAVPDVSNNLALRYNFWNYLKLEITCLREYAAIAYYKLNGWI